ncbi:protein DpdI [Citrobacter koseri]|uniref:protein DpdI n=1 Tax=Citrobacter koseri TaxID=545 RepID=UPI0028BD5C72|nr:protein DpdI [Citrobacter koseri]MDT7452490.1 protein DpdI [Citrobacter koseri]HEM6829107.1 hypothetical protein [Citrobacter koseri]HEM6830413.1 hypothetical protein [Citrobacter koseri]HEM6878737.1 hypothetical protein [Citrobacter koseri]HEM6880626.1 hypothetical protein [Citrobacter koseri]
MNTLKQQLTQIRKEFQVKKQVKKEDNVYEKYRQVRDDLYNVSSSLKVTTTQLDVISRLPSPLSQITLDDHEKAAIYNAEIGLKAFVEKFQHMADEVQQKGGLGETLSALMSVQSKFAEKINSNWRTFINDLESKQMLESVFLEQQKTLGLDRLYNDYRTALEAFNRQKMMGPANPVVIKKLQQYCDEMVQLKGQMDFKAPASVLNFFQALNNSNRAPLTLLTPEVLAWLTEKEMLNSFNVMRKGLLG